MVFSALLTAGFCLLPPLAGPEPSPAPATQEARTDEAPARTDEDADSREHLTAEDVLKELRRQRPSGRTIAPVGTPDDALRATKPVLYPEGYPVVGVTGRLTRPSEEAQWWTFVPDESAKLPPLKVLRNLTLEPMVRTVLGADRVLSFEVYGTMTAFEGENYLLIEFAVTHRDEAPQDAIPDTAKKETRREQAVPDSKQGAASTTPTAEDVLDRLLREDVAEEPVSIAAVARADTPAELPADMRPLIADDAPMIRRPARLVRHGPWWTLVFESDHPGKPEPPMKVLPNKNLEVMVHGTALGNAGVVFVVSGTVTVFDNENYVLIRAARRRLDSGNLRK